MTGTPQPPQQPLSSSPWACVTSQRAQNNCNCLKTVVCVTVCVCVCRVHMHGDKPPPPLPRPFHMRHCCSNLFSWHFNNTDLHEKMCDGNGSEGGVWHSLLIRGPVRCFAFFTHWIGRRCLLSLIGLNVLQSRFLFFYLSNRNTRNKLLYVLLSMCSAGGQLSLALNDWAGYIVCDDLIFGLYLETKHIITWDYRELDDFKVSLNGKIVTRTTEQLSDSILWINCKTYLLMKANIIIIH